jgi:hypothetical protein
MKKLAKVAGCTLTYLVGFDVAGALVSLFFGIVPLLGVSSALFYAIWKPADAGGLSIFKSSLRNRIT